MAKLYLVLMLLSLFVVNNVHADCMEAYAKAMGYNEGVIKNQDKNNANYASLGVISGFLAYLLRGPTRAAALGLTAADLLFWMEGAHQKGKASYENSELEKFNNIMSQKAMPVPGSFALDDEIGLLVIELGLPNNPENYSKVFQELMKGFADNTFCPKGRAFTRQEIVDSLKQRLGLNY